jgi:2-dehydro-3-deoxygalactonokinase
LIHAGAKQLAPADVMRGEETQMAGLLAENPEFKGLVCLPGTHTKWATVDDGQIQSFDTYLTGELFTLLAEQSVLRLTLPREGWNESAFLEALHSAMKSPEKLLSQCFSLRAEALLNQLDGVEARSRLSGYLIGQELCSSLTTAKPSNPITLIGSEDLVEIYRVAIESLGFIARTVSNETAILAGLAKGRA